MKKKELPIFDRLKKVRQGNNITYWKGKRGLYRILKIFYQGNKRSPVRKVYIDREYLTGLWKSKKGTSWKGDYLTITGKQYLLFVMTGSNELTIFELEDRKKQIKKN